jgi:hypothetical protein
MVIVASYSDLPYRLKQPFALGRPFALDDPKKRAEFLAAVALGVPFARACRLVGITPPTFRAYRRQRQDFAAGLDRAEVEAELLHLQTWHRGAEGEPVDWRASAAFLARRYRDEWGNRGRHESAANDGGPIHLHDGLAVKRLTEAELEQLRELQGKFEAFAAVEAGPNPSPAIVGEGG